MERENQVLENIFKILKDEKTHKILKTLENLEDGYAYLKEKLGDITEEEYKQAIQTIKDNDGYIEIDSKEEIELSDEELEKISGGLSGHLIFDRIDIK